MRAVSEFLKKELRSDPDPKKIESNLAAIIKLLAREDWSKGAPVFEIVPYDIEAKISYNQLNSARVLIDDYKVHHTRIRKIYEDFDKQGANKSLSVLNGIRTEFLNLGPVGSPDQYFTSLIERVCRKIRASSNYTHMPDEELVLSVQILVVDAFIRCKIFKNPLGTNDAGT